jgi:phage terminase large subunit GpA-like protein
MKTVEKKEKRIRRINIPSIWSERVRGAWSQPEELTVSQWADRERILPDSSAASGKWRTDETPYLRGIMDAFTDPHIEEIIMCMPTQVGKTECMLNMLGYAIDQDPGPAMWVDSTQPEATEFCQERITPMIEKSPALSSHLTNNSDHLTKKGIRFDRMNLKIGWATSPSALASRAIRYLLMNEMNKWPAFSGREADPVKLAKERTRTFTENKKVVGCSTPTTQDGYITREYDTTDKRKYYVPCPHCNHYQILVFSQIKFPKEERNPEVIKQNKLAHYECIKCNGKIIDSMKPRMLQKGRWVPDGFDPNDSDKKKFPIRSKVGFWLNALYSPWLIFSDIAAEWLSSFQSPDLLMNFVNSWLAEAFNQNMGRNKEDDIESLANGHEANIIPMEALVLTGTVDLQKHDFVVTLRAFGYESMSWGVYHARLDSWEAVERVMFKSEYKYEDGSMHLPVQMVLIDSGDGNRTDEAYAFCIKWRGIAFPIKGHDRLRSGPFRPTKIERYPSGEIIPNGVMLYNLDTTFFKDKLSGLISNSLEGTRSWSVHKNPSRDYLKQMCSEHKVIIYDRKTRKSRMEWQKAPGYLVNDYWDNEVYQMAAAEILRVFYWKRPDPAPAVQNKRPDEKPAWIPNKPGWIKRK